MPHNLLYKIAIVTINISCSVIDNKMLWLKRYLIFTSSPSRFPIIHASPFFLKLCERSSNSTQLLFTSDKGKEMLKIMKKWEKFLSLIFGSRRVSSVWVS